LVIVIADSKALENTVFESSKVMLFIVAFQDRILINLDLVSVVMFLTSKCSIVTVLSTTFMKLVDDVESNTLAPSMIVVE